MPTEWKWKIFYEDGSTFSSLDGETWESPVMGTILIAQPGAPEKGDVIGGDECYLYRADKEAWISVDWMGFWDQIIHFGHHINCVRPGRQIVSPQEFRDRHKAVVLEVRGK